MKTDSLPPTIGQQILNDLVYAGCPNILITEFCDISPRAITNIRKGQDSPYIPRLVGLTAFVSLLRDKKFRDAFRELINHLEQSDSE